MIPWLSITQLALSSGMVFLLVGLGELFSERAGVLNIGLEGMMLMGSLTAVVASEVTGNPWIGVGTGMVSGAILGMLHGVISISLKQDQIISGSGIWLFGLGVTSYFGGNYIGRATAPFSGTVFGFSPIFFIGLSLPFVFYFVIYKTHFGLKLRAVGEDPLVAVLAGINVTKFRYIGVIVGGALAGLSGAYLSLVYLNVWTPGLTAGRGWIALALIFFSTWSPIPLLGGSLLFGAVWIFSIRLQGVIPGVSPSLLQTIPYLLTLGILVLLNTGKLAKRTHAPAALGKPFTEE